MAEPNLLPTSMAEPNSLPTSIKFDKDVLEKKPRQQDIYAQAARAAGVDPEAPVSQTRSRSASMQSISYDGGKNKPPRTLSGTWDSLVANVQMTMGKLVGSTSMVEEAEKKKRVAQHDALRLSRTISAGAGESSWVVRTKRRLSESHVAVPPGYNTVWGGGAGGIAGIPSK